jgi:alkanesulfonate monooxygenase SsuD/methylene tetrahydromethanopterin reductase-like flavin-dependent oxidoreductase (luciferase family)
MTDFRRELRFGYFLVPNADDPLLETARELDELGLDLIGVQDHPYQRRFVETFSLLGMVLARTSRISVFPDVANLPLRPPAVLTGAQSGPVPPHPIGIWIGAYGPRALALTARVADGWVPSLRGDVAKLATMTDRLDEAAAAAGRDPAEVRRILNVNGTITDGRAEGLLHGPVDQWVDELTDLATSYGIDTFVLWSDGAQYRRFAEEVAPAVRRQVATERAR